MVDKDPQSLVLKCKGLFTNFNELSSMPTGSLLKADNIDISRDNIAEPRRGFDVLAAAYASASDRTDKLFFYQDKLISHNGTQDSADTLSYFDSGTWTNLTGTFSAPASYKMRGAKANQNLYLTSSDGIKKLDSFSSTPVNAGGIKALDLQASLNAAGSGFLTDAKVVAYRLVWGYKDANDNLIIGSPSQREEIENTTGGGTTKDVDITFTIPENITTSWFYQLYRTAEFDSGVEPNDEMQIVYEDFPSSAEITAKTVTITDTTDNLLRGATLYTSPSQGGIASQNEQPPLSKDIEVFRDVTFYANTTSRHRYNLAIIAIGGSSGLVVDDTITIDGVTYTGKVSEDIANAQFDIETGGTVATNIRDTALSLVRVINRHSNSTVYAYYLSGDNDLPGKILLEARDLGDDAFVLTSSRATCWNPSNIPSSGTTETSVNDEFKNGIMWSHPNQPEHVPLTNQVRVGSADAEIQRIMALREALIIFKEDGIYRLTGYSPRFDVELLDSSAKLVGAETPSILNNQIYCFSDQGIVVVSDGVRIISYPIDTDLRELQAANLTNVKAQSWGVGYETDKKYYLFLPTLTDSYSTIAYVYNTLTESFTKHDKSATCGVYYQDNLYLGDAESANVLKDRKAFTYLDYADYGFTTTISTINSSVITLTSGVDNIKIGDILYQSDTIFSVISDKDPVASTITVGTDPGFTAAACTLYKAIDVDIQWAPILFDNPGIQKQFHTVQVLLREDFTGNATLAFESDAQNNEETVTLVGSEVGAWGLFGWGGVPWGGSTIRRNRRQWIPLGKQRSSELIISFRHYYGFSSWLLQGLSIHGSLGSERASR